MVAYIIVLILIILYILRYLLTQNHDYWKKRNVAHLKPLVLFGNYKETILLKKHPTFVTQDICNQFSNVPYIGTFFGTAPALVVLDPGLIKLVLATDFYYFNGREITDYAHKEILTRNVFFSGGDSWKIQRQNLTPLYTSAKMKGMFHLIASCANQFECLLKEETQSSSYIEARALLAKFTIDCITSCVFGLNSNTMKKDAEMNPFMIIREKIFDVSTARGLKMNCRMMWPALFYSLKLTLFNEDIANFFRKFLSGVFEERRKTKSSRNDFVDLILGWEGKKVITGDSIHNIKTGGNHVVSLKVDEELLMGQCLVQFGAGFETTTSTASYLLYELAKNPDAQMKVIQEVDAYFEKRNGKIEYECVNELPYIAACVEETLRLYPVLGLITREVMDNYTLPTGLRLTKGDRVHIPVYHIHHNPDYFPDPEEFKPERFYGEERKNIKPFTFFPFGEGPRTCIGLRFAKMPMSAGLLTIFKDYRVELAEDMPRTLQFQPHSFVTNSANDINLKFIKREK